MNKEAYKAMKKACENFVNKVETGKARSKNSYKEMKKALQLAENNEVLDLVSLCLPTKNDCDVCFEHETSSEEKKQGWYRALTWIKHNNKV